MLRLMLPIVSTAGLAGCAHEASTAPVPVAVPGMPSPELALQKSLDRISGFLGSLNERIPTPARQSVALATTPDRAMQRTPAPSARPETTPDTPEGAATSGSLHETIPPHAHEATPLYGKGVVWFGFGDGYARIRCTPGQVCIVRLQKGETMEADALAAEVGSGWRADLVRGTRGIHAGWAVVLTPSPSARSSVLRFTTNRRSYVLALEPSAPAMRIVAFTYSPNDPATQPDPQTEPAANAPVVAQTSPDFSYTISGPEAPFRPMRVYRDGGHTYIQFPPGGINSAPRLVVLAPAMTGTQPYRVIGDSYVVDRPVDDAMLIGAGAHAPVIRMTHGGKA